MYQFHFFSLFSTPFNVLFDIKRRQKKETVPRKILEKSVKSSEIIVFVFV